MKVDSPEYNALMAKWSREANAEEMQRDAEEYAEHQDNYRRS